MGGYSALYAVDRRLMAQYSRHFKERFRAAVAYFPSASGEDRRRGYSAGLTCGGARPAALSSAMICCKHLDAVPGEGWHAILADAVDPEAAVFGEHVDRQLEEPVFVLRRACWRRGRS
jgi:hypothetical protein